MELIESRDGEERAAKLLLPSRNILQRSLFQLFPLGCDERRDNSDASTQKERTPIDQSNVEGKHQNLKPSKRQIAKEARNRSMDNVWRIDK